MEHVHNSRELKDKAMADFKDAKQKLLDAIPEQFTLKIQEFRDVESELIKMGFDPEHPDLVPITVSEKDAPKEDVAYYNRLLKEYKVLKKEIGELQGDQYLLMNDQIN